MSKPLMPLRRDCCCIGVRYPPGTTDYAPVSLSVECILKFPIGIAGKILTWVVSVCELQAAITHVGTNEKLLPPRKAQHLPSQPKLPHLPHDYVLVISGTWSEDGSLSSQA